MSYTAESRIYCNREMTAIVPEDTPEGALLLVAAGGTLTDEEAARWGLTGDEPADESATVKAIRGSKNKAQSAPDATKAEKAPDTVKGSASFDVTTS